MPIKRRKEYLPMGDPRFEIYHTTLDRLRANSKVINPSINVAGPDTKFFDRNEYLGLEQELVGSKSNNEKNVNHEFFYDHTWRIWQISHIPGTRRELAKIELMFNEFQQSRVNAGFEEPTEWPAELFEKKLKLEARLDMYEEELELVQKALKDYVKEDKEIEDKNMLKYGLKQVSRFHGLKQPDDSLINVISIIDGQKISEVNGLLVITSKNSPYRGLRIIDYRKLAKEWQLEQREKGKQRLIEKTCHRFQIGQ